MISLNEEHNMEAVLQNVSGWAQEVFLVDSFSQDKTVDIALSYGVHVVQRRFLGFGDQWNFALRELPIKAAWTMKLDPDERLSDELKVNLNKAMNKAQSDGFSIDRSLWFMERHLSIRQDLVRVWRTGSCRFSDVLVNEYPLVEGSVRHVQGELAHFDSPDLEHWLAKQNRYTTEEAITLFRDLPLASKPRLFGNSLQRRMWLKKNFFNLPLRYFLLFLFYYLFKGTWRVGWVGFIWARLRTDVMRMVDYKYREMQVTGKVPIKRHYGSGKPNRHVPQYD